MHMHATEKEYPLRRQLALRLGRELPKQIRQMINRRRHQPSDRLKGRLVRCIRVTTRRNEFLCSSERSSKLLRISLAQDTLQFHEIFFFFLLDVLRQIGPERLQGWREFAVGWFEALEFIEEFFDLSFIGI